MTFVAWVMVAALGAGPGGEWQPVQSAGPLSLKVRSRPGTQIEELWAEAELDAPAEAIQAALMDEARLPKYQARVKEARTILEPQPDGSTFLYVLLSLPIIGQRDYVVRTKVDSRLKADGTGEFKSHWTAAPDAIPVRHNISRIKVNDGSWKVTPVGPSRSRVEYKAFVDPGGVPAASVNSGNRTEISLSFKALEAEAKRRAGGKGSSDGGTATPPT